MKLLLTFLCIFAASTAHSAPLDQNRHTPLPFIVHKEHARNVVPAPVIEARDVQERQDDGGVVNSTSVVTVDSADAATYTNLIVYSGAGTPSFVPSTTAPLATATLGTQPSGVPASSSGRAAPAGEQANAPSAVTGAANQLAGWSGGWVVMVAAASIASAAWAA